MLDPNDAPEPDLVYANYLRTCAMLGIEPVPRERVFGLVEEWNEVSSGRPEPTTDNSRPMGRFFVGLAFVN